MSKADDELFWEVSLLRILVLVRYAAWLAGDLGRDIVSELKRRLDLKDLEVTRLPRGILVGSSARTGPAVEHIARAIREVEDAVQEQYPMFHAEMGPVWTGTLQVVFGQKEAS